MRQQKFLLRLRVCNDSYVDSHQNDCYSPGAGVLILLVPASQSPEHDNVDLLSGLSTQFSVSRAGESPGELREGTWSRWSYGESPRAKE